MLKTIDIQKILPHRYPFLLVDRVTELEAGRYAKGYKNLSNNEEFFNGHFPGNPIMPGVLQVEALAQLGAVAVLSLEEYKDKLAVFAGIDAVRFKRQVVPGDRLDMEVEITQLRRGIGKGKAKAFVDGELCVEGEILFALVDPK